MKSFELIQNLPHKSSKRFESLIRNGNAECQKKQNSRKKIERNLQFWLLIVY